ncbi:type II toxin-antitoxin system HipA family toxin [Amycolatopsis sp. K13G38]|uniref:Type II toxin-antitoxin system HipA family toxin n=1 Tax=Amycolatopsis acididurans TaxID=2724524 RepID=A0ABX1J3M2_9PSEU|nr:type II toxin-antitoxin system HipA family toxin [Amycolatopsis acididurans]NKQ53544.1 type II toxin-antitoxin system HipA family toxin [Amycolatopsis acididurans]
MIEAAHAVWLNGRRIGTILQRGDVARFLFVEYYWDDPTREVLGLWFEDDPRRSPQAALRLPAWFSNLLPEGALRQWIARDQGVSADRELQLLLRIGRDLPGAVQVIPADEGDPVQPELLGEVIPDTSTTSPKAGQLKFSLAGVGLKFSLLKKGERLTIPAGDAVGDWIVKFPDPHYRDVPANEFATMSLAGRVGITIPEVNLVHRDELPPLDRIVWPGSETQAYAVARFDRGPGGQRIHIEDFAQVRGFYADDKYSGSFETVAALVYRNRDRTALQEFVRRLTFNLLVGNGDAHLKNWSLIYADGRVPTLSPAYDLVSTGPYFPENTPDDFGLKFGGTKVAERIGRGAFQKLQQRLGVTSADVLDIVDQTIERFTTAWDSGSRATFPQFVADWIDTRCVHARKQLGA